VKALRLPDYAYEAAVAGDLRRMAVLADRPSKRTYSRSDAIARRKRAERRHRRKALAKAQRRRQRRR
jgi:hypothetical protein